MVDILNIKILKGAKPMANKKIKFYQVFFQDNNDAKIITDISFFFKELQDRFLNDKLNLPQMYHDKKIYLFEYTLSKFNDYSEFVIPFGKMKTNAPYKAIENNIKAITQETERLFDVNLLYYSKLYDAAIITTDKEGPSSKAIEAFLNCFLDTKEYSIRIKPILKSEGIEKVRESQKVRSINISINLDPSISDYFNQHINSDIGLLKCLLGLMNYSKYETNSKTIKLELGMGHHRDYIDFDCAMALLNELQFADSDIFKEIRVNYLDGHSEKIETVRIKNTEVELSDQISRNETGSVKISELMEQGPYLLEKHIYTIRESNRIIDRNMVNINNNIVIQQGELHEELQETTV